VVTQGDLSNGISQRRGRHSLWWSYLLTAPFQTLFRLAPYHYSLPCDVWCCSCSIADQPSRIVVRRLLLRKATELRGSKPDYESERSQQSVWGWGLSHALLLISFALNRKAESGSDARSAM